jgi:ubiquinone/menaquinone biosynthesis C-methylase UbiE
MDSSYPGKLRVWEGAAALAPDSALSPGGRALPGPHHPSEFACRLYADEACDPAPAAPDGDCGAEPYSLQWFLDIENHRHSRRNRWIPRLLEFTKHAGETLLGVGQGLGTDWVQYARHGAHVVVCCPSASQLTLIRHNFELRGLSGRFVHAAAGALPLESNSIDVACINTLLHPGEQPQAVVEEIYRVLKPGGKVLAVAPAKYDVGFWRRTCFFWRRWLAPQADPRQPGAFSARRLRRLFGRFVEHRIHKRQLRRSEVPLPWRWLPLFVLERLLGRVLVLKAFKPLSAAINTAVAA